MEDYFMRASNLIGRPEVHSCAPCFNSAQYVLLAIVVVTLQQFAWAASEGSFSDDKILSNITKIPDWIAEGKITASEIPNPHWNTERCHTCHTQEPVLDTLYLRFDNKDDSCDYCHDALPSHIRMHPVNQIPTARMMKTMSGRFAKRLDMASNRILCTTCHNLSTQCISRRFYQQAYNSGFIRGAPYPTRTGLCYECHRMADYKQVNAHDQVLDNGALNSNRCLICHRSEPSGDYTADSSQADLVVDSDWSSICINCHTNPPHPASNFSFGSGREPANHLVKPDSKMLDRMKTMMVTHDLNLPLEPGTGKIFCGTCHNPHEQGVIRNSAGAKGTDVKQRLRTSSLCIYCHDV
jgi:hypothetical protein